MEGTVDLLKGAAGIVTSLSQEEKTSNIGVFIGEALGEDEKINNLMAQSKPEITILIGFVGYGKTSFVASCYQILLTEGKIGEYTFYDSDTLTGLERRLFLRRYSEELKDVAPAIKRTLRGEPHLLTFRFKHPQKGNKVVVISDHSGEDYQEYVDKKVKLQDDILLKYADRLIFFVDCENLTTPAKAMKLKHQYTSLITNMKEFASFKDDAQIQFLFNKVDLTEGKEEVYQQQKESFLQKMSEVLGETIRQEDCPEVISNQTYNNKSISNMLLDIVDRTIDENIKKNSSVSDLDWVKHLFK
ncbi:MAG: hypothetical protein J6Q39_04605 [Bacteroidales bacterium]|nr:hypothetical protein [Bacteroidales bacterium]